METDSEQTPEAIAPEKPASDMSFLEHLEDFRKMLIGCAVALVLGIAVVGIFLSQFSNALIYPLHVAMGDSDNQLHGLITTGPMGVFSVIFQVCIFGGFFLALPAMLFFAARFLSPALSPQEKRLVIPASLAALVLFVGGALFSYFFLVPVSLKASQFFNDMLGFETIWRADKYYGLLLWMVLGVGASFEFPLVVISLVKLRIITVDQLRAFRRYSIVGFMVIAALITPTGDPFTMTLLAAPMILFYELAILFCRNKEQKEVVAEDVLD